MMMMMMMILSLYTIDHNLHNVKSHNFLIYEYNKYITII